MKVAFKWRADSTTFLYITGLISGTTVVDGNPMIYDSLDKEVTYQSGTSLVTITGISKTMVADVAIQDKVKNFSETEYATEYDKMVKLASLYPATQSYKFMDYSYYYNLENDECVEEKLFPICDTDHVDVVVNALSSMTLSVASSTTLSMVDGEVDLTIPSGPLLVSSDHITITDSSLTVDYSGENTEVSISAANIALDGGETVEIKGSTSISLNSSAVTIQGTDGVDIEGFIFNDNVVDATSENVSVNINTKNGLEILAEPIFNLTAMTDENNIITHNMQLDKNQNLMVDEKQVHYFNKTDAVNNDAYVTISPKDMSIDVVNSDKGATYRYGAKIEINDDITQTIAADTVGHNIIEQIEDKQSGGIKTYKIVEYDEGKSSGTKTSTSTVKINGLFSDIQAGIVTEQTLCKFEYTNDYTNNKTISKINVSGGNVKINSEGNIDLTSVSNINISASTVNLNNHPLITIGEISVWGGIVTEVPEGWIAIPNTPSHSSSIPTTDYIHLNRSSSSNTWKVSQTFTLFGKTYAITSELATDIASFVNNNIEIASHLCDGNYDLKTAGVYDVDFDLPHIGLPVNHYTNTSDNTECGCYMMRIKI